MSNNPSARKIHSRLEQIRKLEKECIYILIEHPTCLDDKKQKGEMIELAIFYIESKLNRATSTNPSYAKAATISLSIALQELEEALGDHLKKKAAKKVTQKLLEMSEAELMLIPGELKEAACKIASMYLAEL